MANTTEKVLQARIKLVDNFSRPLQQASKNTQKFQQQTRRVNPLVLKAKDLASKVVNTVTSKAKAFGKGVYSATIKAKDMASSTISSIQGKLMALAGGVTVGVALKTGVDGLASEQTQKLTIDRVIQNSGVDATKSKGMTDDYYAYLTEFANKTPFETSAVAQFGTKAMMMSKGNIDNAKKYTEAMGNVKAFTGDLRTETEVAESFFSASNGNMDMLNNMLGENYKSMDEAMKGIEKKQGGLTNAMSGTIGGLMSTITGKTKDAMKNFVKVFEKPLSGALNSVIGFVDKLSPKLVDVADKMLLFYEQIQESGELASIMQFFGNVASTVWDMIKIAVEACRPVVESIMKFMIEHSDLISGAISGLKNAWEGLCKILSPLLQLAWKIIEPILASFLALLERLGGWIKNIGDWWEGMCNKIKNNPIVAKVSTAWDKATEMTSDFFGGKSNAFGSGRIAKNGELHRLHQGEKVLTKQQANELDRNGSLSGGITVNMNGITVREEADINKIAKQFVRELKIAQFNYVGGN